MVAASEAVKEVMFVLQLLLSMKIKVKLLIIGCVDNVGVIFMTINITTIGHIKHVDICYKCVTEYVEDGIMKIILVKSVGKDSDIMTKNLGSELLFKHAIGVIQQKTFCDKWEIQFEY